jgi:hypothetical protein
VTSFQQVSSLEEAVECRLSWPFHELVEVHVESIEELLNCLCLLMIKRLNRKPPLTTSIVILLAAVRNQFSAQSGF